MRYLGTFLIVLGFSIFYFAFFKAAPYIATLIPQGEWHNLASIGVYAIVAYIGGFGLPIVLIVLGVVMLIGCVTW